VQDAYLAPLPHRTGKLQQFQQGWSGSHSRRLRGYRVLLAVDTGAIITFVLVRGKTRDGHLIALLARHLVQSATWAGYAACIWALIFAAITGMAHEPAFVAVLWGTGVLKVLGGLLALALVQRGGHVFPRKVLLSTAWGVGILMAAYGGASWVQEGLMVFGVISIPAGLGSTAALWHVLLWDPWWLLGGILFISAAWIYGRKTSDGGERMR
jgi:Protein of unknown function (DUF3995)